MSYNCLVLFDTPIILEDANVYGLIFDKQEIMDKVIQAGVSKTIEEHIHSYIEYIIGCKEWMDNGNIISDDKCYFIEGKKHTYVSSNIVLEYCKVAYKTNPLKYRIIENVSPIYHNKDVDGSFIISEDAYNRYINEYGKD